MLILPNNHGRQLHHSVGKPLKMLFSEDGLKSSQCLAQEHYQKIS
jgi:hypothetical protein